MPAATSYNPDDRALRTAADDEFAARIKLIDSNAKYYRGEHKKHLKKEDNGADDNVILNLVAQAVDRTISFSVPDFPTFNLDNQDEQSDTEKDVRKILDQGGDAAVLLKEIMLNGAVAGHAFVRIVQPANDQDMVRIVPMVGERVIKFWEASDVDITLWYELRWMEGKAERRQDIVAIFPLDAEEKRTSDTPLRWQVIEYKKVGSRWEVGETHDWNYPLAPIVDVQHLPKPDSAYGVHEFEPAPLNDVINKVASDINKTIRYHSGARTIGTGFEASEVQATAVDQFWTIPKPEAKVYNLEMSSGALQPSMDFLKLLVENFFDAMRVRMKANADGKATTATEVRLDFSDMLDKTKTLWSQYGKLITGIIRRVLMLKGIAFDGEIALEWEDPLPTDELQNLMIVEKQLDMGLISKKTAAKKMGIDYDAEVKQMENENGTDSGNVLAMMDVFTQQQPQTQPMPMQPVAMGVN